MKRFWTSVATRAEASGHAILLDGRPVRSPARRPLLLPTPALAEALAAEWAAQGDTVDPREMPLTRMAGTAVDALAGKRDGTADAVARYAQTDMVCYWADQPQRLLERQQATWRPLLDWMQQRFGVHLRVTTGLHAVDQPAGSLSRLHALVHGLDDFRLVPLSIATGTAGSLVIGLALLEGRLDAAGAFEAAELDETHQIEQWGEDHEAARRRDGIRAEFAAIERFVRALQG